MLPNHDRRFREEQRLIKTLPRKGFRFVGAVGEVRRELRGNPRCAGESSKPELVRSPDKPSIAVLPFEKMSGDFEQEYFAMEWLRRSLRRFHGSSGCS